MSKDVKEIIQALESCYLGGDVCDVSDAYELVIDRDLR